MKTPRHRRPYFLPLAILMLAGCGEKSSIVSGTVLWNDKPLNQGEISFIAADGRSASGTIDGEGHYQVSGVPRGELTVLVESVGAEGDGKAALKLSRKPTKLKSAIPERYGVAETSPLKVNVHNASHKFDFALKDE